MQDYKSYLLLGILVIFVVLLIQNTSVVTLRFLIWKIQISQLALLLLVALGAYSGGYITHVIKVARKKRRGVQGGTSS